MKQVFVVVVCLAVLSFLWALGANARKRVELEKSTSLSTRVENLIKSNTVLSTELKKTKNEIAASKKSDVTSRETLQEKEAELQQVLEKLKTLQTEHDRSSRQIAQELARLRNINTALGDELTKTKQEYTTILEELKNVRAEVEYYRKQLEQKAPSRSSNEAASPNSTFN